uniref:Vomeronasal type-1 receptor n=1 Tax=Prolemur simus TaxID=1328070 RepID=A0A8C8ZL14_PROSS
MASRDVAIGMIFLSQTAFGILGNCTLLYHYLFLYFTGHRLRSTDLILKHLIVANSLAPLFRGVPQTMADREIFSVMLDANLFSICRVGRGVSISTTCLLSVFQAIKISVRNCRWAELKMKAPKYTGFSILLCWILQMLVNITHTPYVTSKWRNTNVTVKKDLGFCSGEHSDEITLSLITVLLLFPDVSCLVLMLWASSSMSKATKKTLVLVNTFVSLYTLPSIFQVGISYSPHPTWLLVNISALISVCFPTPCPFVLMSCDLSVSRPFFIWLRNAISAYLTRNI